MADDIDIEEHDVLESLRRRQQPGTSIVKSEPLEIEYEESNYEESQWEWEKNEVDVKLEPHTNEFHFGKIILGSKPAQPPEDTPGCSQDEHPEGISEENYNYNMSLVLDDWGPILERSNCYCQTCEILFATVNALDAHKMISHSFLIATEKEASPERNKAIKSTAKPSNNVSDDDATCQICHFTFKGNRSVSQRNLMRHYKRIHKVDPRTVKNHKDIKSWRVCNHCNLYFPDDTSLVKHLYELLPLNDKPPSKDDNKTNVQPVKPKPVLNVSKNISQTVKASTVTNKKEISSVTTPVPNKIILGSKPMAVKSENTNQTEQSIKRKCEICSVEYVNENLHMKRFHPDFLSKKQPNKIILGDTTVRYKCLMCSEILTTEYATHKHRHKHPNMKGKRLYVKIVKNKNKAKAKPNVIKREPVKIKPNMIKTEPAKVFPPKVTKMELEENTNVLVSRSILFKCNRCSVHFLTCTGACQHSIVCESSSNIRDWSCPKCSRVFKSAEKTAHEYQHKMLKANTFRVYVVYLEMIVRILCQCPNCFVCFEEDKFWRHVNGGCGDAASYFCNECRLPIDIHAKANHDSKHKQGDFTKEDFIKIDYISSKPEFVTKKIKTEVEEKPDKVKLETKRGVKRKLEMPADSPEKRKKKNSNELLLFYCQFCKSYLGNQSSIHKSGSCGVKKAGKRGFCDHCGIYLKKTYHTTHMLLHVKIPNLTIADFTFVKLTDSKKLRPVQKLYPCKTCKVNFLTKRVRVLHKCESTASTECLMCRKKIQSDLFESHVRVHNYAIPRQVKTISDVMPGTSVTQSPVMQKMTKTPMPQLPDLLMKYQSLTALWNILYLCSICDTFTDSYDKVVEHCQNHLTNMENYGVVIKKCEKCDMKFDSECYKRHLELHAGKVVKKKTFQILKYEYYELFSNTWFDFIDLPEEQKSQIVRRSIYGKNRCVKMKLIQQGPPEYTLYKCDKCLNCITADSIVHHVKLSNCLKANKVACTVCNMTFAIRRECEEHEKIHESTGLGQQSFRIVSFNDAKDAEANQTIMSYDTENHGSKSKISFVDDEIAPKTPKSSQTTGKTFVFYKCAVCGTCVAHMKSFQVHKCNKFPAHNKNKLCDICGVNYKHPVRHRALHQKYSLTRNNVITKTLNKDGNVINIKKPTPEKKKSAQNKISDNNKDEKPKLYKCFCGLHYTSLKSIEKHYKMKNCSTVIREKCSQCNLVFDPIEVVNHLCKHHAQSQINAFDIITPNKKTLYKCGLCHVLFYNKAAAIPHKSKCSGKFCGKKCGKCGLAFDASSLATHMVDHERNNKLKNDCYIIVKIPDDVKPDGYGVHPNILYKCKSCDIHFLRRTSARNHIMKRSNCNGTLAETCKICKRQFPAKSIMKHVAWQHNKLKIKEFHVKELTFGVNMKLPRDNLKAKMVKRKEIEATPLKKETIHVRVYRCTKCMLLFTDERTLLIHHQDRCSKELTDECEECDVKFASKNIKDHNRQHRPGVALSMTIVEDIQTSSDHIEVNRKETPVSYGPKDLLDRYDNKLYKCTICNVHYLTSRSLENHTKQDINRCNPEFGVKCDICDLAFTSYSLSRHKLIHKKYKLKKEDFVILSMEDIVNVPKTPDNLETETKGDLISHKEIKLAKKVNQVSFKSKDPLDRYFNKLYRCKICNIHYLTYRSLENHADMFKQNCNPDMGVQCDLCGFAFTRVSLKRHKLIHEKYNFKTKEDFVIMGLADDVQVSTRKTVNKTSHKQNISLDTYDNKLFKCTVCNLHFLRHNTLEKHAQENCEPNAGVNCEVCNIAFTKISLKRHKSIHEKYNFKKGDFDIFTLADFESKASKHEVQINEEVEKDSIQEDASLDSSLEPESTENNDETKIEELKKDANTTNTHFLYKCAECNVYYVTRVSCHKHIAKHTLLDPKEYIECKLCGFQFTLMCLPGHIKKHHGESFNLKEVLVEEYKPNDTKTHETYYASEKDQSTLVSTSEDVKNNSILIEENDCEVSSCNEITEKVDSSNNSCIQDKVDVADQETKVEDQSTSAEPTVNSNADVDSSDNKAIMNIYIDDDKTKVSVRESNVLSLITESSEDVIVSKTNDNQPINVSKEIVTTETIDNIQVDSSNERNNGNIDVKVKNEVTDPESDNLKDITEPSSGEDNLRVRSDTSDSNTRIDDASKEVSESIS